MPFAVHEQKSRLGRAVRAKSGMRDREASMKRRTAGIVFMMSVGIAALAGTANAQNSPAGAALDTSLRGAVERKDVPGVVALITDRQKVLYQSAFGVAD